MKSKWWIRKDRGTGKEEQVFETAVRLKLQGYYNDVELCMEHATKEAPATTGYADYFPQQRLTVK